ncbi:MAG: hypothetical protein COA58_13440 [Bacteroidetes bacterium]|nr:MAG: hypothetical protein COA58_13440 [Bacteroidota bacterium]
MAFLLCSVVLFSSFGLTVNIHLCQDKMKTFSLLGEAQKCLEMTDNSICKTPNLTESITTKKCCSETSVQVKALTETDIVISFQTENLVLGLNPYPRIVGDMPTGIEESTCFYRPPPDNKNGRILLVLHQTFLI